jgi:hypothetical protein
MVQFILYFSVLVQHDTGPSRSWLSIRPIFRFSSKVASEISQQKPKLRFVGFIPKEVFEIWLGGGEKTWERQKKRR